MNNIIDYVHTIPGITALQANTLVSMIESHVDGEKAKIIKKFEKANRKGK